MGILSQVTRQIKSLLPLYTNHYSTSIKIIDYTYEVISIGGNDQERLIIEVDGGTELKLGDFLIIDGVNPLFKVEEAQYDTITGILYLKLNKYHQVFSKDATVILKGFDPDEFNGEFPLISAIESDIQVQLPTGLFLNPLSGEQKYVSKLLSDYVNGYHEIVAEPSPSGNILTVNYYVIKDSDLDIENAVIKSSRVSAMVDTDKFLSKVTNNSNYDENYWVYVTLSETNVDMTEVTQTNYISGLAKTFIFDVISVYACYPIKDETGLEAVEILRDEVFRAVNKCVLFKYKPTIQFWDEDNKDWEDGQGNIFNINSIEMFLVDNVKVIYRYDYVYGSEININDGFNNFKERRWKYFHVNVNNEEGSTKIS